MSDQRGNWYLLTGVLIGMALGLLYAWVISPVKYVDTAPSSLAEVYKDNYRQVIALAYLSDGDLVRAHERLNLLDTGSPVQMLAAQAQRVLAENPQSQEARALAVLAAELGKSQTPGEPDQPGQVAGQSTQITPETIQIDTPTPTLAIAEAVISPTSPLPTPSPTVTRTPVPTFTPRPTATQLSPYSAPFVLQKKVTLCDGSVPPGLILVNTLDSDENPIPGVKISIYWEAGSQKFYTGLIPEQGPGYADFATIPGTVYDLTVGEVSDKAEGLLADSRCSWSLVFQESAR